MYRCRFLRTALVFSVVSLVCTLAVSSHAIIAFERVYGGPDGEDARCVRQTSDGGYIIAGSTESFGAGHYDWYLVKTDSFGGVLWERVLGLENFDRCSSVLEAPDGGFVASGIMSVFESWSRCVLFKMNSSGDSIWARDLGFMDYGGYISEVSDGGYIIVGATWSYWTEMDLCLLRTDSAGNLIWSKKYGGSSADFGDDVCETADGGFVATGTTWSFVPGRTLYLVKTDTEGGLQWQKTYGGGPDAVAYSVLQEEDRGFLLAGFTDLSGPADEDACLVRTDSLGDSLWARTYGGPGEDYCVSHQKTTDGGYIMAGCTRSYGAGGRDVYLIKTDSLGNIAWTRTFGGLENEDGTFVRQTSDGGYVIVGMNRSFSIGSSDAYLIKTDQHGRVGRCIPVEPWEPRTQGYWRRQCKDDSHEDICAYVDSVYTLVDLFDSFGCDSICDLMNVHPPENDMCRKARRQFMALLLNVASGKLAVCNCLEDDGEVGDVIAEIDSLLSDGPDFHTCVRAKTLADNINNGIGIVPCDTVWAQAPAKIVEPLSISATPNPFSKSTVIEYELNSSEPVRLEVFDKTGRLVRTLLDGEQKEGMHQIKWDGSNDRDSRVPAGIYFCRLQVSPEDTRRAGDFTDVKKMILLR